MIPPRVSIVIPTRNGIATLPAVLDAIARQDVGPSEIVAIDSGSSDGTPELLSRSGARVICIPAERFNHGTSRNEAVAATTGDLVVLLVQDAVPIGSTWLSAMIAPFGADPALAGSFARQVPADGATALARWSLSRWVAAGDRPRTVGPLTRARFDAMAPAERHAACAFDNVCACVRRLAWECHPFACVPIAEDLEWARDVLLDGWRIAYVPDAQVRHSHDRGVRYEFERTRAVHARLVELFGLTTVPTLPALATSIARTIPEHLRVTRPEGGMARLASAAALGFAWPAGQYAGARDARRAARRS